MVESCLSCPVAVWHVTVLSKGSLTVASAFFVDPCSWGVDKDGVKEGLQTLCVA